MNFFAPNLRMASDISRWSVARTLRRQNIAEHMFYVAHYSLSVASLIEYNGDPGEILAYAITHDLDEVVTGDIPGPIKRSFGTLNMDEVYAQLNQKFGKGQFMPATTAVKYIVKTADRIDEIMFGAVEVSLGNKINGDKIIGNGMEQLRKALDDLATIPRTKENGNKIFKMVSDAAAELIVQATGITNDAR